MTEYGYVKSQVELSQNSDFSHPLVPSSAHMAEYTNAGTLLQVSRRETTVPTTGTTLPLYTVSTADAVLLENLSQTPNEDIIVTWYHYRGSIDTNIVFSNANPDTIGKVAGGFTAAGAEEGGYVYVSSAEDAANNGIYYLQAATNTLLTVANAYALTANADDDACALTFVRWNKQRLAPGAHLLVNNALWITGSIWAFSISGTPKLAASCLVGT